MSFDLKKFLIENRLTPGSRLDNPTYKLVVYDDYDKEDIDMFVLTNLGDETEIHIPDHHEGIYGDTFIVSQPIDRVKKFLLANGVEFQPDQGRGGRYILTAGQDYLDLINKIIRQNRVDINESC